VEERRETTEKAAKEEDRLLKWPERKRYNYNEGDSLIYSRH